MKGYIVFNKADDSEIARFSGGNQSSSSIISANGFDPILTECLQFNLAPGMKMGDFSVVGGALVEATVSQANINLRIAKEQLADNTLLIELLLNEINVLRTAVALPTRSKTDIESFLDSRL